MSQLADMLGHDHPLFVYNVAEMEKAAGGAGIDTRLIADITAKGHEVMRHLGIDPADTLPQELYQALNAAVRRGDGERLLVDTKYTILLVDGEPISFNFEDVIENVHHNLEFSERTRENACRHLRAEIIRRYAEHERTNDTRIHHLAKEAGLTPKRDEGQPELVIASSDHPRILAIGDVFTDAFIQLDDATTKVIKEADGKEWLALPFGQKPPYTRVDIVRSVGPSPNAAVSFARLGLDSALMAWIGGDDVGREAMEHLQSERVDTASMVREDDKQTSYWYVLRYQADRTMLVKSEHYRYEWRDPATTPDWVYLSYLGADSWPLHEGLLDYLERNPDTKLVFQPGTFHFKWGREKLAAIYRRSHVVVMNREEAVEVTGASYDDLHGLFAAFHELGPKIVVITDGPNGSYASFDGRAVTIPNYPDVAPPFERTGAGDAFASTIVAALALGETMETALTWAPINSMNVVQKLGAQAGLQTRDDIAEWLTKAPAEYKVTDI